MSNTKKSAKDIAFDKERQKFQKEIKELKEKIISLSVENKEKTKKIIELSTTIESLNAKIAYISNTTPE